MAMEQRQFYAPPGTPREERPPHQFPCYTELTPDTEVEDLSPADLFILTCHWDQFPLVSIAKCLRAKEEWVKQRLDALLEIRTKEIILSRGMLRYLLSHEFFEAIRAKDRQGKPDHKIRLETIRVYNELFHGKLSDLLQEAVLADPVDEDNPPPPSELAGVLQEINQQPELLAEVVKLPTEQDFEKQMVVGHNFHTSKENTNAADGQGQEDQTGDDQDLRVEERRRSFLRQRERQEDNRCSRQEEEKEEL